MAVTMSCQGLVECVHFNKVTNPDKCDFNEMFFSVRAFYHSTQTTS